MRVAFGKYQLDTETRALQLDGRRIPLQSKVYDLLAYLIERRERVVYIDELLDALWPGLHVTPAALSRAVQKARQAVGDDGEHQTVIQTEHGKGFRFVAEVTDLSTAKTAPSAAESAPVVPVRVESESAGPAPRTLIAELKRRNVFRVAAAYGIVAWLLVEVASVVLPTFDAPAWVMKAWTFLLILGFPLALILAWVFELTPDGIKLERRVDPAESITRQTGRKLDFAIIALLAVALVFVVVDRYLLDGERERAESVGESRPVAEPIDRGESIAVLPFVNMSANEDEEYFADGIAEELLNMLAHVDGLRVAGRTSSFSFRHSDADLKQIGEALKVDVILEGSVRTAGDRVRVAVQLNDAKDGFHRWSEIYDREVTDIFAIQTEIATSIAAALRLQLSPEQSQRLATPPTRNLAAYQAYLLGRQRLARGTTASVEQAIQYFQQALELDPKLAPAYLGLTQGYMNLYQEVGPTGPTLSQVEGAARKALELDDRLAEAHVALAIVHGFQNAFDAAEDALQRALKLNPNSVEANIVYGDLLAWDLARYDEALARLTKAVELDPLSVDAIYGLGRALEFSGRFDESLAAFERILEIDPGSAQGYGGISWHDWFVSGRLDEAAVRSAKYLASDPRSSICGCLGSLLLELGDADRAESVIRLSLERDPENFWANVAAHDLALYRGDESAALDRARKAFAIGPVEFTVPMLLRDHLVAAGRYAEARALFEKWYPELLSEPEPRVDARNYRAAIDLALILSRMGEPERADLLLERGLEQIRSRPRLGRRGYMIADVQAYTLRGEKSKALSSLRQAIDAGWRAHWWYLLQHKPDLELLRDEPEFQAMVEEIRADMAAQLARVHEMEQSGEVVFPSAKNQAAK